MEKLYNYLFHYNTYTGFWNAFKRDTKDAYFNGTIDDNDVLKNQDINVLISYISSTEE